MKVAKVDDKICVACGCCVKVCKKEALFIVKGMHAIVNTQKCIGCGICKRECPASIIEVIERSAEFEKEVV